MIIRSVQTKDSVVNSKFNIPGGTGQESKGFTAMLACWCDALAPHMQPEH